MLVVTLVKHIRSHFLNVRHMVTAFLKNFATLSSREGDSVSSPGAGWAFVIACTKRVRRK